MLKGYQQIPTIYRKRPWHFAEHGVFLCFSTFPFFSASPLAPFQFELDTTWTPNYMLFFSVAHFHVLVHGLGWTILITFHIQTHESSSTLEQQAWPILPPSGIWGFPSILEFQYWYMDDIYPCVCSPTATATRPKFSEGTKGPIYLVIPHL